jgi:hypothetical protein
MLDVRPILRVNTFATDAWPACVVMLTDTAELARVSALSVASKFVEVNLKAPFFKRDAKAILGCRLGSG